MYDPLFFLPMIPRNAVLELYCTSAKYVHGTPNGQIDLASTQILDRIQVLQAFATTRIRDRNVAPRSQLPNELVVNTLLKPLVIGGMDEELGAIRLKEGYRLCKINQPLGFLP